MSYLADLPADIVKIDQSFVRDLFDRAAAVALITDVMKLAQSLGVDVIAQGVETEEQQAALSTLGCLHSQGYLYSKPHSADDFVKPLRYRGRHAAQKEPRTTAIRLAHFPDNSTPSVAETSSADDGRLSTSRRRPSVRNNSSGSFPVALAASTETWIACLATRPSEPGALRRQTPQTPSLRAAAPLSGSAQCAHELTAGEGVCANAWRLTARGDRPPVRDWLESLRGGEEEDELDDPDTWSR